MISAANRKVIVAMQVNDVVHVLSPQTARQLHKLGLVRLSSVDPAPERGIAVNLTTRGRSLGDKPVTT